MTKEQQRIEAAALVVCGHVESKLAIRPIAVTANLDEIW
jgi:hypothetical protein